MASFDFSFPVIDVGTAFIFGSWTCIADVSGDFICHLDDLQAEELDSTNQQHPNNSAALAAATENPPEDSQEEKKILTLSTDTAPTTMCHLPPMTTI